MSGSSGNEGGVSPLKVEVAPIVDMADHQGIQLQADGRLLIIGNTHPDMRTECEETEFGRVWRTWSGGKTIQQLAISRYHADGRPDSSFSGNGTAIFGADTLDESAIWAGIRSDGKILVVASASDSDTDFMALYRRNADGSKDSSYGTMGSAMFPLQNWTSLDDAGLLPDGRLLVLASTLDLDTSIRRIQLCCFDANGHPDASFGTNGRVDDTLYNLITPGFEIRHLFIRQDGGFSLIGRRRGKADRSNVYPAHYSPAGKRLGPVQDPHFRPEPRAWLKDIFQLPDHRLLFSAGLADSCDSRSELRARHPDFSVDHTFCGGCTQPGRFSVPKDEFPSNAPDVCPLPDGRMLVIRQPCLFRFPNRRQTVMVVNRIDHSGAMESSFATGGRLLVNDADEVPVLPEFASDGRRLFVLTRMSESFFEGGNLKLLIVPLE